MNNIDSMIAYLCDDVKQKNEEIEKRMNETDYDAMTPATYQIAPKSIHPETAEVNKTFNSFRERAKVSNLTDSFREIQVETSESKTERSLAASVAGFFKYHSIIQAVG